MISQIITILFFVASVVLIFVFLNKLQEILNNLPGARPEKKETLEDLLAEEDKEQQELREELEELEEKEENE